MALFFPIPGETPIEDPSGLLVEGIFTRQDLNRVELANILQAVERYFATGPLTEDDAPFDYSWALRLHREMFGEVWDWAGTLRQEARNIGVPPEHIETSLYDLLACLPFWESESWLVQATRLHYRTVVIHPFKNGNGRWARMLANIWLHRHEQPYTRWPDAMVGEESEIRSEYINCLKAADNGDETPLVELHRRYTPQD
jgi:Fic-DOC domain mobile mystery protein B